MEIGAYIGMLIFTCFTIVSGTRISQTDDDLIALDLSYPSTPSEELAAMVPDIMTINFGPTGANDDMDESDFNPVGHDDKKPAKRNRKRKRGRGKLNEGDIDPSFGQSGSPGFKSTDDDRLLSEEVQVDQPMTPVDVRSITWKPESIVKVDRCERGLMRSGVVDSSWNETTCVSCSCKSSRVVCERPQCPQLECEDQIQTDGDCCPRCPEKLCEAGDGRRFKHSDEWHLDDCTYCECDKGKVLCSVEDCQVPTCDKPIKVPGQCCPICFEGSCHASNGTKITSGEVWKEDICTHCYCAGGEKRCAQEKCPYINCSGAYQPPGKCCHRCNSGVVDCVESSWGSWSECPIQECGGGMRRRYRSVVIPSRNGGNFCPHMSEAEMCSRLPCDVLPVCPVTEWSHWSHCTATCGSGRRMRSRTRAPTTKATMTSLIDCSTTHFQETAHCYVGSCLNAQHLLDHVLEMGIHDDICFEVTWSDWGQCSASCGGGIQRRHQVLINVSHPRGHLCHLLDETRNCQGESCALIEKSDTRCKVSPWGDWTPCSKTCGSGSFRTKHREILQEPSKGGRQCRQRLIIRKSCKTKSCHTKNQLFGSGCLSEEGRFYHEGERWTTGSCISCQCISSQEQCERVTCSSPECQFASLRSLNPCCESCSD
uniref:kielin/chordin-like protein n=1 Tax=Styela clava TaxID=7725 RepID=UPI00193A3419|nr:kielin/chordin-like protein [Styela clava]